MNGYLVTVKLPKNPDHNPRDKKTGICAVSARCTDVTGEHHTVYAKDYEAVEALLEKFGHITRVETLG